MKRGRWIAFLMVVMAMLMLVGCNDDSPELTENTYEVYYLGVRHIRSPRKNVRSSVQMLRSKPLNCWRP